MALAEVFKSRALGKDGISKIILGLFKCLYWSFLRKNHKRPGMGWGNLVTFSIFCKNGGNPCIVNIKINVLSLSFGNLQIDLICFRYPAHGE